MVHMGMGENDTICPRCNIFDISLECSGSLISTDIIENTNGGIVVSDSQFMTGSGEISFCNSCFITFSDSSMRYDGYTYGSFSCILTCWHSIVCEKLIIKYILDAYLQINFIINNLPSKNPFKLRGFFLFLCQWSSHDDALYMTSSNAGNREKFLYKEYF